MGIWDAVIKNDKERQGKAEEKQTCAADGAMCPECKQGRLAYDGKLNLVCPNCSAEFSQGFT